MPRPFHPTSRAEALGGTLADIRQAAAEDQAFLHGLAQIVADLIAPPAATDTQPADRVRRDWQQAHQSMSQAVGIRTHG